MFGGYASFWLFNLFNLDPFLSLPLDHHFLLLIGAVLYQLIFVRMVKLPTEEKIKNTMLVGFGLTLILQNIALNLWTADDRGITTFYTMKAFTLLGVRFPYVRVAGLVISLVCLFACSNSCAGAIQGKPSGLR